MKTFKAPSYGWVVNLRDDSTSKEKIMKKKIRYQGNFKCKSEEISEQEYIDKEFKALRELTKVLEEKIQILSVLHTTEHIFIDPGMQQYYKEEDEWLEPKEGREMMRKKGYIYIQTFEFSGELWVKEDAK